MDSRMFDEDLHLSLQLLKRRGGWACGLLYRNMNDGKAIYKAEKATPGGLAGCTLYLSQRHLGLICWSHCQQAPVFLALTCKRPWKFWQTAKQAVSSGAPPAFRLPRTVHGVALSRICIRQALAFMVHVCSPTTRQNTFLLNPLFCNVFGGLIQLSAGVFLIQPCVSARPSSNAICSEVTFLPWFNLRTDSILAAIISCLSWAEIGVAMIAPSSATS